ncbi:beta-lactamase/transpeptidase-like protein [Clathrospora elynae]|uniref:Beta-lactamase/transpeptidase-like protein n=1 Tax=Clathrospora elynae TaxID=706981 RepID=A0A6A5SBE4_9PLEO|nr:beta-lactamase/transpeptidase-like protein [Clathrospora elynae]
MDAFESYLQKATAKGANIVPGAVMAVVDKDGNYIYKNAAGYNGVNQDAKPVEFDQTFFVASCTKLIAAIAALQTVERGLMTLDEPIDKYLPELASQPIVEQDGSEFTLREATNSINLRQLITHSSGTTYDWISPKLQAWRASRGEASFLVTDGDVAKGYAYPRVFESGEGWEYSGGFDWTSLLVERLTNMSFEDFVETNVAKPLGITSFTWHLPRKPAVEEKLMRMSHRQEDGTLIDGANPFWPDPKKEGGGAGMYANVADFSRVLSDLLKDAPVLLRKDTVDQMFTPQFAEGSSALKSLTDNGEYAYACALDASMEDVKPNFGLGSLLLMEDVKRENYFKPKNTLSWTGLPNLLWSINRERGMALFFAQHVSPWADRKAFDLVARFETAVWRNLKLSKLSALKLRLPSICTHTVT